MFVISASRGRSGRAGNLVSLAVGASLLLALGCSKSNPGDNEDAGGPPVNQCPTRDAALSNPACVLVLGQVRTDYIRSANDQVWYTFTTPANAGPRTLIHITAGYSAPSTPVNLSMNILQVSGGTSLSRMVDNHQQAAPRPLDMIIRYAQPNAQLLVFFSDQPGSTGRPGFDPRNQFSVKAEIVDDPDLNEPNDVTPTPIPLTNQGGILVGSNNRGYLATNDDIDLFSVNVGSVSGRKVIYVHVGAPQLNPPPNYRMIYALYDPNQNKISEDVVTPQGLYSPVNLATARLMNTAGTYIIDVRGYKPADSTDPVPGDLRLNYTVDVKVMDDVDVNEPNDTITTAKVVPISAAGDSASVVGRLGYVPDQDWFEVDLAANGAPTLLHYRLRPLSTGGRFPPLPKPFGTPLARQVRVFGEVTDGSTIQDRMLNCKNNSNDCPKGYEPANLPNAQILVEGYCQTPSPGGNALCLQGSREESVNFANLKNFEGMVHVPPHGGSILRYFLVVRDGSDNWADDMDYQLDLDVQADPEEASFYSGGVKQPRVINPFSSTMQTGVISYGYGRWYNYVPSQGQGLRAEGDYDCIISDTDTYELDFPAGITDPMDRAWGLQWQVAPQSPGVPSYELGLDITFCNGDAPDGGSSCVPVTRSSSGAPLRLAYKPGNFAAWHNPGGPYQPIYDRLADFTTIARNYGCFCFEPRFIRGGKFFINVSASDRNTWTRTPYTLSTSLNTYPQSYTGADGGMVQCPPPVFDGGSWGPGCQFTRQ